jgi:carbon monoxide dehydrogenase subunit G
MKYVVDIKIQKPIEQVIRLFEDSEKMKEWMKGLQSFEHLSGTPKEKGAKSKLVFLMGKRKVEMVETIIKYNLPEELSVSYEAKGVYNIVTNRFSVIDENTTLYITEQEFEMKGFMKLMLWLMPGAFKKQSVKYLLDFKAFVEKE